ncbi:MAG: hypothetical protein AABZ39_00615 [Spirochaetota bacterium]
MRVFSILLLLITTLYAVPHLSNARLLTEAIIPEKNRYAHERAIQWPSSNGSAVVSADCSSLLNELWTRSYLKSDAGLLAVFGKKWPKARDWYRTIDRMKYFLKITNILDIAEGDIIAIYYPRGMVQTGDTNTGHVMLVNTAPKTMKPRTPTVPDAEQYALSVIDSTESPHGKDDTRAKRKDVRSNDSGIGIGTIRLFARSNAIIGYAWSMTSTNWHASNDRPIVIGRYLYEKIRSTQ